MKAVYRADEAAAWALFESEPYLHVAGQGSDGQPVLRTFNAIAMEGCLWFHAGAHGEKRQLVDRPVVVQVERPLGIIPSYFVDPELACPATTYFFSAQASGVLREVSELSEKARVLEALMARHQPEGGHAPIDAADPRYAAVVRGLWIAALRPERVVAKHKLGQNRSRTAIEGVQRGLWQRGTGGDLALIRALREMHPARPNPEELRWTDGVTLCPAPDRRDAERLCALLREQYWWQPDGTDDRIVRAHLGSRAWLVARGADGELLASARALGDGARRGSVYDVVVRPELRARGLGTALMARLLDHPLLRDADRIELRTRDAHGFYAKLGFEPAGDATQMCLERPLAAL